jgi:hypothetical protein
VLIIAGITALIIIRIGANNEDEPRAEDHPDSLVASWVRVYPPCGGCDTMVLHRDGSAAGPATSVYADPVEPILSWVVGVPYGPTDLCFIGERNVSCSGWVLKGDTLALANGQNTVLIRAARFDGHAKDRDSQRGKDRDRFGRVPVAPQPGGNRPE